MQIKRQRQRQIRVQIAFMRFVEENRRHAFKPRIGLQAPHQQAFGHHLNPRAVRELPIKARGKPNGAARLVLPKQGRHAARGSTGSNAARFQHQDAPFIGPGFFHERERHDGGLARTRRRDQHGVGVAAKGSAERRQRFGNGQFGEHGRERLSRYTYPCDASRLRNQAAGLSALSADLVAAEWGLGYADNWAD